jgi:DNA-binding transcriptional LysR family regulator
MFCRGGRERGVYSSGKALESQSVGGEPKNPAVGNLLDRRVFSRTSRSLELTAEGEILLNYAGRLLALNKEILERIGEPAIEGIVRVGVVEYFGQQFLPGLLAQFKQARPNVRLSVEVGMSQDLVNALAEGKFDFVIATAGKIPSSEVKMENVTQERILITEPLVWTQAITSPINAQINPVPLVLIASPCSYRRIALEALEKRGRPWQIVYTSSSLGSLQSAALAGLGITICGRSSVLAGMKIVDCDQGLPKLPKTSIAIYSRQSAVEPLAKHLAAFIIKAVDRWESEFTRRTPVVSAALHPLSFRP